MIVDRQYAIFEKKCDICKKFLVNLFGESEDNHWYFLKASRTNPVLTWVRKVRGRGGS